MKRIDTFWRATSDMKLHTEDLKRIGHTVFSEGTNTIFLCSIDTVNMEAIFLREILRPLGYKILSEKDWLLDGHHDDLAIDSVVLDRRFIRIKITTDFPWSDYEAL